ncbi:MAG: type II toxin-antitoxin system prevent-host-death family antitoxin [Actinobacteria bacterium]|nr:type II toxin-antitoxin system prevent-host-death family antitoxin [Actinomycetota bacterium]
MTVIGLRELRQHASHWVERAAAGETIDITDRGRPVAQLVAQPSGSMYERLLDSGDIAPAASTERLGDVEPLGAWDGPTPSKVLEDLRDSDHR